MSYHRRCAGQSNAYTAPVAYAQDVTVTLFNGCTVSGPAQYRGKGIARSQVLHRLNAAHDGGNLSDSFTIGGVLVSFANIQEVK